MIPFRTFCLALPEYPEKIEKAKAHFQSVGLNDVTFFYSLHAEKCGLSTQHTYDVDNPGTNFRIGYKPTGIWLAHYALWAALNLLWDEHFLVLETDAQFHSDWHSRMTQALQDVPRDFDALYVGSCCASGKKAVRVKGEVYDSKYPFCTHAIIWAKKALPTLLNTQRKVYAPIDLSLCFHSLPLLKCYTVLPRIVEQFDTVIQP
jgi:hypothetical protein